MRFLIRYHIELAGDIEFRDVDFEGSTITIGHGIDQIIKIPGKMIADAHAVIELKANGKGRIRAQTAAGVVVNGSTVKSAELSAGDVITVASSRLEVIHPPSGFGFALASIRTRADGGADASADGGTDANDLANLSRLASRIEYGPLNKRRWSWLLFLGLLTTGLLLPLAGTLSESWQSILHHTPLPSDELWATGPLQPAHQQLQCDQCHTTPFIRVRNQQCAGCHEDVGNHIDLQQQPVAGLQTARCAGCHIEHNEPGADVHQQQRLCSNCHTDLAGILAQPSVADVSDFAVDHPDFKLTLLTPETRSADTGWKEIRHDTREGLKETSNLRFPHTKHLDPQGVKSRSAADGREVLACSGCHQADAAGQYLLPINMEQHCRRCHELSFDPDDPERQVPHGDPDLVKLTIEEYYSRKFLNQLAAGPAQQNIRAAAPLSGRRRPGRGAQGQPDQLPEQVDLAATDTKIGQATEQAMRRLFARDAEAVRDILCLQCHVLQESASAERRSNWLIVPVKLTGRWLPLASFNHHNHRMTECRECHQAQDSKESSDILIPSIETCHSCHGGQYAAKKINSACVMCHRFHQPETGKMTTSQN